jgi:hypothetical protein
MAKRGGKKLSLSEFFKWMITGKRKKRASRYQKLIENSEDLLEEMHLQAGSPDIPPNLPASFVAPRTPSASPSFQRDHPLFSQRREASTNGIDFTLVQGAHVHPGDKFKLRLNFEDHTATIVGLEVGGAAPKTPKKATELSDTIIL